MRAHRNEVWDMFGNYFTEHKIRVVPKIENQVADSLATTAGNFKTPIYSQKKYKIQVVNRPSIPDKSKYCQVFYDDMHTKIFLEMMNEFVNTQIDTENENLEKFQDDVQYEEENDQ